MYREESEQQARFDHTYKQQDANAWGADAVYLLYDAGDQPLGKYLLFFQNSIVELWLDWEPSADQMSIIGQKLNP